MGTQLPLPQRGTAPNFRSIFLRPNGCMDQDVTWCGARPRPRRLCVKWGPRSPSQRGAQFSPIFGPFLLWPNGSMHQYATWYGCWPQPRGLCVRSRPSPPSPTKGAEPPPNFRPISIVPKRLDASRCHLVWMLASAQGTLC